MRKFSITVCILVFVFSLLACTKKEAIQSTSTLGGALLGVLIGDSAASKAIGATLGAGAGYLVGGWLGDYFSEEEQVALETEIKDDMSGLEKDKTGTGEWESKQAPENKAVMTYSQEAPASELVKDESEKPEIEEKALASEEMHMCREATVSIEKEGKVVGSQKQLWCRTEEGDYAPSGDPYGVVLASGE